MLFLKLHICITSQYYNNSNNNSYCTCHHKCDYPLAGISCKVIPTQIIGRLTGDTVPFPSGDNCTHCNDTVYFHCYSPTTLSDNIQFNKTDIMLDRGRVYRWRYSPSDVPVLFLFPTNSPLNDIKLYYENGPLDNNTLLGFPMLTFYHVPNDFEIWNYSNLSQLEQLTCRGSPTGRTLVQTFKGFLRRFILYTSIHT